MAKLGARRKPTRKKMAIENPVPQNRPDLYPFPHLNPDYPIHGRSAVNLPPFDFYATPSAAEIARQQGVRTVSAVGQIQPLTYPDAKEAERFAREVRRWRNRS
jgi:hypothetical protein